MRYDIIIVGGDPGDAVLAKTMVEKGFKTLLICGGRLSGDSSREEFRRAGGTLLMSDKVTDVEWDGDRVQSLRTANLKSTPLQSDRYILCSGRFFTRGLMSDDTRIWEPVFGCDVKYDTDRSRWCKEDFFAEQPFESFGVEVAPDSRAMKNGNPVENLWACGEILCDKQDNKELICKSF